MAQHGSTPLLYSSYRGFKGIMDVLLDRGADIEATDGVRIIGGLCVWGGRIVY